MVYWQWFINFFFFHNSIFILRSTKKTGLTVEHKNSTYYWHSSTGGLNPKLKKISLLCLGLLWSRVIAPNYSHKLSWVKSPISINQPWFDNIWLHLNKIFTIALYVTENEVFTLGMYNYEIIIYVCTYV